MTESWRDALTELLARLSLERAGTPELIDWAVGALEQGADGPALRRLAGLYRDQPMSDARPWLEACLREGGIVPATKDALLSDYAALLAQRILAGTLAAPAGLGQISALNYARHDW